MQGIGDLAREKNCPNSDRIIKHC